MTDCADRTLGVLKLLRVTPGARQMLRCSRTLRHGRVRISAMTQQARKARMVRTAVLEFRVVEPFGKFHLHLRRLRFRRINMSAGVDYAHRADDHGNEN